MADHAAALLYSTTRRSWVGLGLFSMLDSVSQGLRIMNEKRSLNGD